MTDKEEKEMSGRGATEPQTEGHAEWCDCSICVTKRDNAAINGPAPSGFSEEDRARLEKYAKWAIGARTGDLSTSVRALLSAYDQQAEQLARADELAETATIADERGSERSLAAFYKALHAYLASRNPATGDTNANPR